MGLGGRGRGERKGPAKAQSGQKNAQRTRGLHVRGVLPGARGSKQGICRVRLGGEWKIGGGRRPESGENCPEQGTERGEDAGPWEENGTR